MSIENRICTIKPCYENSDTTAIKTYKVVDESGITWFIGTYSDCEGFLKLYK